MPLEVIAQAAQRRDLRSDLDVTLADAGTHWGIAAQLAAPGRVDVPGWLSHEVQQLVREAVANAARHGAAREVTVTLASASVGLDLTVADDGCGFDAAARAQWPRSISERVAALDGVLSVESGRGGTRLAITLPTVLTTGALA